MKEIDIVVPWVDSSDPQWIQEFNRYAPQEKKKQDANPERYRDYGLMRFWFRGIEKFAPWARTVHFITNGQKPAWLNTKAGKLHWVQHNEYIPSELLPVFSSRPIDFYLHKIPGLSEQFVYFNDDFFLTAPVKESDFFYHNLPVDIAVYRPLFPLDNIMSRSRYNNVMCINMFFQKKLQQKKCLSKIFHPQYGIKNLENFVFFFTSKYSAFLDPHFAQPYTKELYEEVWKNCNEYLTATAFHKFRSQNDVSIWLFRYWNLVRGKFYPRNILKKNKYYDLSDDPSVLNEICTAIEKQRYKQIILNDAEIQNPDVISNRLKKSFEKILPEKSSFEL